MQRLTSLVKTFTSLTQTLVPQSMFSTFQRPTTINNLLPVFNPVVNQSCGFKVQGHIRRRCKSCYIVIRDERVYNICPKFPKHKRMSMKPKPLTSYILTHATQGKKRGW